MYTMADRARFIALAETGYVRGVHKDSERYQWGVRGTSRPGNDVRVVLRDRDLVERQGGICPQCGKPLGPVVEFCHLVARGPHVKGFIEGNIFAGHPTCNKETQPVYGADGRLESGTEALMPSDLARPDLIAETWTPKPILRMWDRERKAS
jgi:hypothetical protein